MWPKLLIVVTCLYVARASVPSIFDEEDASNLPEVTRTARSCGFASCNSFCRKLGHARGVCIGTYCQCRFRRRRSVDEDAAVENAIESNEKSVVPNDEETLGVTDVEPVTFEAVYVDDSSEDVSNPAEVKQTARSCEYNECNRFCRQLGYARGVCIGTYCQCRYRVAPVTPSEDLQQEAAVEDAEETGDQTYVSSGEKSSDYHGRLARAARYCGTAECSAHCRRLGHARGVCIGSLCQCRDRLARSADLEEENSFEDNLITPSKDFLTGLKRLGEVSPVPEVREDCNLRWCEQNCRRIGFPGGTCVNGRCKCDILRSAVPPVPAPSAKLDNLIAPSKDLVTGNEASPVPEAREDCNLRWCEQNCRRIGFPGGACVNGRCKCDILRSTVPAVPAPSAKLDDDEEIQPKGVKRCLEEACLAHCRELKYLAAACVMGNCYCF
ncbi:hypothetical protein ABMA28_016082 [Loxostege sticticalis]|uniref:Uncharacterized protein n=1 Tax=Loxostege sticticalis TaxID=481309 RepID=A0ABD0T7K5_LOXSC